MIHPSIYLFMVCVRVLSFFLFAGLLFHFLLQLLEFFSGKKLHGGRVHAVPLSRGSRPIFKDVPQVRSRLGVHNLNAGHEGNGPVDLLHHVVGGNGLEEGGPTRAAVELRFRVKQGQTTQRTHVNPVRLVVVRKTIRGLTRERTLRSALCCLFVIITDRQIDTLR